MDEHLIFQLGIGGAVAYLLVREVLTFLSRRRTHHQEEAAALGDLPIATWRNAISAITRQTLDDGLHGLTTELREIRTDTTKLRESQHRMAELEQQVIARLDILIQLTQKRA